MTRGRPEAVSDARLLFEILVQPDRAVFGSEIADEVELTAERVRQRLADLEGEGLVAIDQLPNNNIYRLTDDGLEKVATETRDALSGR